MILSVFSSLGLAHRGDRLVELDRKNVLSRRLFACPTPRWRLRDERCESNHNEAPCPDDKSGRREEEFEILRFE